MGKPFIKLLHTINAGYFYDVNRNQLVDVSEESYQYLQDLLADKAVGEEPEEITYLKQAGYLSDHHVEKIEHPYSQYLEDMLNRNCHMITLQVTQNCNFRCRYCVYSNDNQNSQRHHSNKVMSEETAFKAIDFLAAHSVDVPEVNIGFYGGEPLLNFVLVEKCIAYAHQRFKGKKHTFSLTTNASLLNDHIVNVLAENDVNLLISFDGPKEIQDTNRVFPEHQGGTYELVRDKIKCIQEQYPEYAKKLRINMVIDPQFDFDLIRSLEDDEVFSDINMMAGLLDGEYTPKTMFQSNNYQVKSEYQSFLANLSLISRIDYQYLPKITQSFLGRCVNIAKDFYPSVVEMDESAPGGPCIPGKDRLFVNVIGRFFPCERINETAECLCLGTLDKGIDLYRATEILNIGQLTQEDCKKCWAFSHCTICAKSAVTNDIFDMEYKRKHCLSIRNNTLQKCFQILLLQETNRFYEV